MVTEAMSCIAIFALRVPFLPAHSPHFHLHLKCLLNIQRKKKSFPSNKSELSVKACSVNVAALSSLMRLLYLICSSSSSKRNIPQQPEDRPSRHRLQGSRLPTYRDGSGYEWRNSKDGKNISLSL